MNGMFEVSIVKANEWLDCACLCGVGTERPRRGLPAHLGDVHHVSHESKALQLQLGDEGLEEHVDLGKGTERISTQDRSDRWGPTV